MNNCTYCKVLLSITIFSLFLSFITACNSPEQIAEKHFYKSLNKDKQSTYKNCSLIAPPLAEIKTYLKTGITQLSSNSISIDCDTVPPGLFVVDCPPSTYRVDTFYDEKVIVNNALEIYQSLRIDDLIASESSYKTLSKQYKSYTIYLSIALISFIIIAFLITKFL